MDFTANFDDSRKQSGDGNIVCLSEIIVLLSLFSHLFVFYLNVPVFTNYIEVSCNRVSAHKANFK